MEQYTVTGMSCAACSTRVEKAVSKVSGVTSCSVSLLTNSMGVEGTASEEEIIAAVEAAGYHAQRKQLEETKNRKQPDEELSNQQEIKGLRQRFIASMCFLLPLVYLSMGAMMWGWPIPSILKGNHLAMGLLQLLFTTVVMIINQKFFISGFKALYHKAPNMDTLVALGSSASYGYSVYILFAMTHAQTIGDVKAVMGYMHDFYFESAAMILTLITLGKMLEAYSKGKTTDALKGLMKLAPKTAVILENGKEKEVPIEQVKKGDTFVVRPGENIPVDGIVLEGSSAINEAALTGESIPVDKNVGDFVSAATLNQSGFLKCEAQRVGEDTTLSQIIQMVSDAAATKAPIAKVADKVSGIFVPVVMGIALITFIIWLCVGASIGTALSMGISVLVISCPCALGLATPVAIMVGNGMAAKHGIMFKTAVALEETGKTQIVVLDKTGTITKGEPTVTDIFPVNEVSEVELLTFASALEERSEHPLAQAILKKAKEENITSEMEVTQFQAVAGNGLTGTINGETFYGGNLKFISHSTEVSQEIIQLSEQLAQSGKTPLFFSRGGEFLGIIAVADTMKEDSKKAVEELKNMGIRVVMLTGDHERTAKAIGEQAGVDEVIAEVLPDGKESVISTLKQNGKVAMVGDGINDAPALTRADIGIAIGAGADIAIDAADVVLMKSTLRDVPAAIRMSKATLRNIHENLFWAFLYNVIGIPLAAGVWYSLLGWKLNPMFGAAAMSLSSFCVVTNALRLNWFQLYDSKKTMQKKEEVKMTKTIKIEGMMCGHCEAHVKKALEALPEVELAEVSHEKGMAVLTLQMEVSDEVLKKTVEDLDYKVVEID